MLEMVPEVPKFQNYGCFEPEFFSLLIGFDFPPDAGPGFFFSLCGFFCKGLLFSANLLWSAATSCFTALEIVVFPLVALAVSQTLHVFGQAAVIK